MLSGETSFIAVITHEGSRITKTEMFRCHSDIDVLNKIGDMGPEAKLERIFQVDEHGNVEHYEVVFDGRLKLSRKAPLATVKYFDKSKFREWLDVAINRSVGRSAINSLVDIGKRVDSGEFDV